VYYPISIQYCQYTPRVGLVATVCQVAMSIYLDSRTVLLEENVSISCLLTITLEFMTPPQSGIPHQCDSSFLLSEQGCTHPMLQGVQATNFWRVAPYSGFSVRNFLYVMLMAPKILRWLLDIWKICAALYQTVRVSVSCMTS